MPLADVGLFVRQDFLFFYLLSVRADRRKYHCQKENGLAGSDRLRMDIWSTFILLLFKTRWKILLSWIINRADNKRIPIQ